MTEPLNLRTLEAAYRDSGPNAHDGSTTILALVAALRETRAKGEQLTSAINAYIGCEAPPLKKNGPYWKALAPALGQWAAVLKKVIDE